MNAASTRPSVSSCAAASVCLSLKYVRMFWPVTASIAASSDPKRVFSGVMKAERRTKKTGSGVEFADHRDYTPGDDFRYLDWHAYQRFDKLLLRLFEEEEDLSIYFIVDSSVSMGFGDGKKLKYAVAMKPVCMAPPYGRFHRILPDSAFARWTNYLLFNIIEPFWPNKEDQTRTAEAQTHMAVTD